jgi:hypothetical protein
MAHEIQATVQRVSTVHLATGTTQRVPPELMALFDYDALVQAVPGDMTAQDLMAQGYLAAVSGQPAAPPSSGGFLEDLYLADANAIAGNRAAALPAGDPAQSWWAAVSGAVAASARSQATQAALVADWTAQADGTLSDNAAFLLGAYSLYFAVKAVRLAPACATYYCARTRVLAAVVVQYYVLRVLLQRAMLAVVGATAANLATAVQQVQYVVQCMDALDAILAAARVAQDDGALGASFTSAVQLAQQAALLGSQAAAAQSAGAAQSGMMAAIQAQIQVANARLTAASRHAAFMLAVFLAVLAVSAALAWTGRTRALLLFDLCAALALALLAALKSSWWPTARATLPGWLVGDAGGPPDIPGAPVPVPPPIPPVSSGGAVPAGTSGTPSCTPAA